MPMSPSPFRSEVELGLSLLYGIALGDTSLTDARLADAAAAGESPLDVVVRVGEDADLDDFRDLWLAPSPDARAKALAWAARWRTPPVTQDPPPRSR